MKAFLDALQDKDKDPLKVNAKVALTFRKVLQNNDKDINTSCQEEDKNHLERIGVGKIFV